MWHHWACAVNVHSSPRVFTLCIVRAWALLSSHRFSVKNHDAIGMAIEKYVTRCSSTQGILARGHCERPAFALLGMSVHVCCMVSARPTRYIATLCIVHLLHCNPNA